MQKFVVKRVAGENIVAICPVFSANGKVLFVTVENVVRAYSARTGEHVRDFEGLAARAVGARLHPSNFRLLLACSESGELMQWKWETDLPPKTIKLNIPIQKFVVTGFHVAAQKQFYDVIVLIQTTKADEVKCMVFNSETGEDTHKIQGCKFSNLPHNFSVGGEGGSKLAAGIFKNQLLMFDLKSGQTYRESISRERVFTCVTCHPHELTVATGDNTGRVLLWRSCLRATGCVFAVYHWHTLPVADVVFSEEGTLFYSGGKERVLVKWPVVAPHEKTFLPRMADAICHMVVATDNEAIAVSLADNGIQVLDAHLKLKCVIQHSSLSGQQDMSQHVASPASRTLFPAGMHVDPRTRAVVTNSRVGHVQFLDRHSSRLIYNLDVTGLPYLTQERNTLMVNVDVVRLAFSSDGLWLATVEDCREPGQPVTHVKLKYWNFNVVKQKFSLNTFVSNPHFGAVHELQFQPMSPDEPLMAATSGDDKKLKLWIRTKSTNIYKDKMVWQCDSVGSYRNLPAGPLCFSSDGSVLGVGFGSTLTLWVPETCQIKANLSHSKLNSHIRHVVFGQLSCCHLVCVATESCLAVWNLLTLSLDWVVPLQLCVLVPDPSSMLLAAVTTTNQLFMFVPSSSDVLLSQSELLPSNVSVVAAVFAPHHKANNSYKNQSQLVFLSSDQELMMLERAHDAEDSSSQPSLDRLPYEAEIPTPFTMFLGKQRKTDVEAPEKKLQRYLGDPARQAVRQLLTTPAHTLISVARLCQPFLLSFLDTKTRTDQTNSNAISRTEDSEDDSSDSDDDTAPSSRRHMPAPTNATRTPFIPEAERMSMEERLEPLLRQSCDWAAQLQPS